MTTRDMVSSALVAALLMASAFVALPVGTVPVTLQVFVVVLAALLLSPLAALSALGVYLLIGSAGVPVFAGMSGGVGVLAGPTGGYLFGFLVGAFAGSLVRTNVRGVAGDVAAAVVCIACVHVLGFIQLALVTGLGWRGAFMAGIVPFLGIDIAKAAAAVAVASAVRKAGIRS